MTDLMDFVYLFAGVPDAGDPMTAFVYRLIVLQLTFILYLSMIYIFIYVGGYLGGRH